MNLSDMSEYSSKDGPEGATLEPSEDEQVC